MYTIVFYIGFSFCCVEVNYFIAIVITILINDYGMLFSQQVWEFLLESQLPVPVQFLQMVV